MQGFYFVGVVSAVVLIVTRPGWRGGRRQAATLQLGAGGRTALFLLQHILRGKYRLAQSSRSPAGKFSSYMKSYVFDFKLKASSKSLQRSWTEYVAVCLSGYYLTRKKPRNCTGIIIRK